MTWAHAFFFLPRLPRFGGGKAAGHGSFSRERLA
jgi:hypothetical protein